MTLEADAEFFGKEARIWNEASAELEIESDKSLPNAMAWPTIFTGDTMSGWRPYQDTLSSLVLTIAKLSETAYSSANALRASARAYLENENASVAEINRLSEQYGL